MIKITLEFGSVEAAQTALAKLVTPAKVTEVLAAPQAPAVAAAEAGAASPATEQDSSARSRKMRSDVGKPRGPYKPRGSSEEAAPAAATEEAKPAPAAEKLTVDHVKTALKPLGVPGAIALLNSYGVARVTELAEDKYAEIIAKAKDRTE